MGCQRSGRRDQYQVLTLVQLAVNLKQSSSGSHHETVYEFCSSAAKWINWAVVRVYVVIAITTKQLQNLLSPHSIPFGMTLKQDQRSAVADRVAQTDESLKLMSLHVDLNQGEVSNTILRQNGVASADLEYHNSALVRFGWRFYSVREMRLT